MNRARRIALALAALVFAACHVGPQVEQMDVARKPFGAMIDVELKSQAKKTKLQGELLEVRDDGLIILKEKEAGTTARLLLIPWTRIKRAGASELPGIAVRTSHGDRQRNASIEELRNVSRFPQGLTSDLTRQLMSHYGQTTLDTIE